MKRIALPLYQVLKSGKFTWTKIEAESYSNLLYIMSLAIRNTIYNPKHPLFLLTDTSAVESSVFICNWHPDNMQLNIIATKRLKASLVRGIRALRGLLPLSSLLQPYKRLYKIYFKKTNFIHDNFSNVNNFFGLLQAFPFGTITRSYCKGTNK